MISMHVGVETTLTEIQLERLALGTLVGLADERRGLARGAHETVVDVEFLDSLQTIVAVLLLEHLERAELLATQRTLHVIARLTTTAIRVRLLMIGPHFHAPDVYIISTTES